MNCFGCKHLTERWDDSCCTTYGCKLLPGAVIGEDAHWTRESDLPKRCDKYEGDGEK